MNPPLQRVGDLIQVVVEVFGWHLDQLRTLRQTIMTVVLIPLALILIGIFAGAWGFRTKLLVMDVAIVVATSAFFYIAARRAVIGTEIAAILEAQGVTSIRVPHIIAAVETYLRLAAAVVAAQMVVGFMALWVPAHDDPLFAILALLAGFGMALYAIWQVVGDGWWRRIVITILLVTLVTSLIFVYAKTAMSFLSPPGGYGAIALDRWVYLAVAAVTLLSILIFAVKRTGGTSSGSHPAASGTGTASGTVAQTFGFIFTLLAGLATLWIAVLLFIGGNAPWAGGPVRGIHLVGAIFVVILSAWIVEKAGGKSAGWQALSVCLVLGLPIVVIAMIFIAQEMPPAMQKQITGTVLRGR